MELTQIHIYLNINFEVRIMNEDIEKYEQKKLLKLKKTNPDEYKVELEKLNKRKKELKKETVKSRYEYVIVLVLLIINKSLNGPPILYLLIGFGPYLLKKLLK